MEQRKKFTGILCHCIADQQEITFNPELGKKKTFSYRDITAVKCREALWYKPGKFMVTSKNGECAVMKFMSKQNKKMKKMVRFLAGQVPGDVTFRHFKK